MFKLISIYRHSIAADKDLQKQSTIYKSNRVVFFQNVLKHFCFYAFLSFTSRSILKESFSWNSSYIKGSYTCRPYEYHLPTLTHSSDLSECAGCAEVCKIWAPRLNLRVLTGPPFLVHALSKFMSITLWLYLQNIMITYHLVENVVGLLHEIMNIDMF